jgi:hypothetical protein
MYCGKCQNDLGNCVCPDLDERLASLSNVVYRKCSSCGLHYARCKCSDPDRTWTTNMGDAPLYGTEFDPRRPN